MRDRFWSWRWRLVLAWREASSTVLVSGPFGARWRMVLPFELPDLPEQVRVEEQGEEN